MNYEKAKSKATGETDCILVSYDASNGTEHSVLIVGKKLPNGSIDIINAFQREEANELWERLITQKGKVNENL